MGRLVLVHFSDIHIGSCFEGTVATLSPVPGFRNLLSLLNGHDIDLCEGMRAAIHPRRRPLSVPADFNIGSAERLHFVLSGDLTCGGSENDFLLAYQWLLGDWKKYDLLNSFPPIGLEIPRDGLYSVPGNHDQWEGRLWFKAYNPNLCPRWFEPTPWHVPIPSSTNDFILDLFGVDSNSGLSPAPNINAEGEISKQQFDQLRAALVASENAAQDDHIPRLRAIVCHHSFTGDGPLRAGSVAALKNLAHAYDVAAILTGHTHSYAHDPSHSPTGQQLFEMRAPAAVQRTPSKKRLPGFWVHELTIDGGAPRWNAWLYQHVASQNAFHRLRTPARVR